MYTRSILALNKVEAGGGALMISPGAVVRARAAVQSLVAQRGETAYNNGREWLGPVTQQLTTKPRDRGVEPATSDGVPPGEEVLMEEGTSLSVHPKEPFFAR